MQNLNDSGTWYFSIPQANMDALSQRHHNKSAQMHTIRDNRV